MSMLDGIYLMSTLMGFADAAKAAEEEKKAKRREKTDRIDAVRQGKTSKEVNMSIDSLDSRMKG